MAIEFKVPALGESITEATVGAWFKQPGDAVTQDEPLCELETDKVTVEVPAPVSGVLSTVAAAQGETVEVGALLGRIKEGAAASAAPATAPAATAPAAAPAAAAPAAATNGGMPPADGMPPAPAARKMMAETGLSAGDVAGSGKRGQILKEDVAAAVASGAGQASSGSGALTTSAPTAYASLAPAPTPSQSRAPSTGTDAEREERVPMSRLRQTIARRLKDAQNTAAVLTTFNDVDMSAVMEMRKQYKDLFLKRHGVKLGFMGFFVKACIKALQDVPAVNAEMDGTDIIYKNYYHIGVAVGTDKGLVVPVVRDADQKTLSGIEGDIAEYGARARDGKLNIADMTGGSFTISNGGVYGSMMSTPILNAPQSGILGMHRIEQRPIAVDGQVVIRPMMYLALSYDHRVVDGKEAVTFLVRVKENLEDPQRFILDL